MQDVKSSERHAWRFSADTMPVEVSNGLVEVLWGVSLLFFQPFLSSPIFRVMALLAPDYTWGCVLVLLGVAHWWGVLLRRRQLRRFVAMLSGAVWFFITCTFVIVNPSSPACVSACVYGLTSVWVFVCTSLFASHRANVSLRGKEPPGQGDDT